VRSHACFAPLTPRYVTVFLVPQSTPGTRAVVVVAVVKVRVVVVDKVVVVVMRSQAENSKGQGDPAVTSTQMPDEWMQLPLPERHRRPHGKLAH
jgi:hypothetical protein